ncbi:MAG: nitroreductase family protein [Candidatus Bathyarchaeota archaeon]|nr:MAG: nitroreductase family protein [Candidatus Bathyarchaeota archaeon]
MTNLVLEAIRKRRSVLRFETTPLKEKQIQTILEAGRWAPSWLNKQPWSFTVVTDPSIKESLSKFAPTVYEAGVQEAPICIVVSVDPSEDTFHFVEDGTAATQNMALAAYSLGLGSCWIGIFNIEEEKGSSEEKIKNTLEIPKTHRVVSLLPIGVPKYMEEKDRKGLSQLVYRNKFGKLK